MHQAHFRPTPYTRPRNHGLSPAPSSAAVGGTEQDSQGVGQQLQEQQQEQQGRWQEEYDSSSEVANRVCEHVCCQARPFCILDELKVAQGLYNEANDPGSFKRKAILNALHKLSELEHPLTCIEDVKATEGMRLQGVHACCPKGNAPLPKGLCVFSKRVLSKRTMRVVQKGMRLCQRIHACCPKGSCPKGSCVLSKKFMRVVQKGMRLCQKVRACCPKGKCAFAKRFMRIV
eukprot:1040059-Pelagomonas_calceolata.AAC.8